jgi:protein-disulfide isomerase
MKNIPLLVVTLLGTLALIIFVAVIFSQSSTSNKLIDPALLLGDTQNVVGPADAKVTIVEFSDFQCPACLASEPLVKDVLSKHGQQVRFVYRHYPLVTIHQHAQLAAQAAESAAAQGKFWQMHDKLFATQTEWADLKSSDEALAKFTTYAEDLAIDKAAFLEKIQSEDIKQRITKDVGDGTKAGIQATPTFYVNGQQVAAPQLLETVENALK